MRTLIGDVSLKGTCVAVPNKEEAQFFIDKKVDVVISYYDDDSAEMSIKTKENVETFPFIGMDNFTNRSPKVEILSYYNDEHSKECFLIIQN